MISSLKSDIPPIAKKWYVVWNGKQPGIYNSWNQCKEQVHKYSNALFKSFATEELAQEAFKETVGISVEDKQGTERIRETVPLWNNLIQDSIAVDGAWNTATRDMEYQGVYVKTRKSLFHAGPFRNGTNNLAEFLAIVHALIYCQEHHLNLPIYSDSKTARGWVKRKTINTTCKRCRSNEPIFELVDGSLLWLKENEYENKILKWETKLWYENPADFGRK